MSFAICEAAVSNSLVQETHDWIDGASAKGRIGQFGWYTMKDDATLRFARVVQLGWVIGGARGDAPAFTKTYFVKPIGFQVTADATKFHNISHEYVFREGRRLDDVLREFMTDVKAACTAGGRVVAHQELQTYGVFVHFFRPGF